MSVWMTLLVSGVGFFVPFVTIKTALAQLILRFERDDAFWVALAGHCANIVAGAPLFALLWRLMVTNADLSSPSTLLIALFYASIVIPFDIWTAQGIIRGGGYPELDDNHPSSTIVQKKRMTTLQLVVKWSLVSNLICIGLGVLAVRFLQVAN